MKIGECPSCLKRTRLTRHHIRPKTHFNGAGEILRICRSCHDELEMLILKTEDKLGTQVNGRGRKVLPVDYYRLLVNRFLGHQLLEVSI